MSVKGNKAKRKEKKRNIEWNGLDKATRKKASKKATPKRVRTSRPKYSDTIRFLVNGG